MMPIKIIDSKKQYEFNKLQKKLRRNVGKAIEDFKMISTGDKVMVCLSGGKDSFTMLDILLLLKRNAPVDFDIIAVNLDQKQPGFPANLIPDYLAKLNIDYHIINYDTYSIVKEKIPEGKTTCGLCSRLRRGILYSFAKEIGANKIALGHHKDDIVETLFLNMFFGGHMAAMPPKLLSDDKQNIVIRPLAFCRETDISKYSRSVNHPIIPCNLCGSQQNLQRKHIKHMLREWEQKYPGRIESIFNSIQNIKPSQLGDQTMFNFKELEQEYCH
jgi:tRNA 2-thiocytidine biosynthesis protein TtcA